MTDKYLVGKLVDTVREDTEIEGWADAMDCAEEMAGHFDEQIFFGVWTHDGKLMAVFDGNDWFTK